MEYTPQQKVDAFKKHWVAAFGKIWNKYGEGDLYHRYASTNDIEIIIEAIWEIRTVQKQKTANLGDLKIAYDEIINKRSRDAHRSRGPEVPDDCDTCSNTGMAWCINLEEADLCPCDCHWGLAKMADYFDDDMPIIMQAQRTLEMHKLGCFKTKDETEIFLAAWLERQKEEVASE